MVDEDLHKDLELIVKVKGRGRQDELANMTWDRD
jgi:hypothetical protein